MENPAWWHLMHSTLPHLLNSTVTELWSLFILQIISAVQQFCTSSITGYFSWKLLCCKYGGPMMGMYAWWQKILAIPTLSVWDQSPRITCSKFVRIFLCLRSTRIQTFDFYIFRMPKSITFPIFLHIFLKLALHLAPFWQNGF